MTALLSLTDLSWSPSDVAGVVGVAGIGVVGALACATAIVDESVS